MSDELWVRAKAAMDYLGVSEEEGHLISLATFVRTLENERNALRERLALYEDKPAETEFVAA